MSNKITKKQGDIGLRDLSVIQSNIITRSVQGLSLVEKRILSSALAQAAGIAKPIKLSAKEYADTFDLDIRTAYLELSNAVDSFKKKGFTIPTIVELETKNKGSKLARAKTYFNWLSRIDYIENEAILKITFNNEIHEFLFDLTEHFTKYQLKQASALRSLYSFRLLELFEQMRSSSITRKDKEGNTINTQKKVLSH